MCIRDSLQGIQAAPAWSDCSLAGWFHSAGPFRLSQRALDDFSTRQVITQLTEAENKHQSTVTVLVDVSKVFDRVWHKSHLYKLALYPCPPRLLFFCGGIFAIASLVYGSMGRTHPSSAPFRSLCTRRICLYSLVSLFRSCRMTPCIMSG